MNEIRIVKVKNGYILYTDNNNYPVNVSAPGDMYVFETQEALFKYLADNFKINDDDNEDDNPSLDNRPTIKVGI